MPGKIELVNSNSDWNYEKPKITKEQMIELYEKCDTMSLVEVDVCTTLTLRKRPYQDICPGIYNGL